MCFVGSGFKLERILSIDLEFTSCQPRYGCTKINLRNLPNPKYLFNIPNVVNNKCFIYAIAAHFYRKRVDRPEDYRSYRYKNQLSNWWKLGTVFGDYYELFPFFRRFTKTFNLKNVNFPCTLGDIRRFVTNNPKLDLKINIFNVHQKRVYPALLNIGSGNNSINLLAVVLNKNKKLGEVFTQGNG